jgi:hypothetical protein
MPADRTQDLRLLAADFVPYEDVLGAIPRACVDAPKRNSRLAVEYWCACADDDRADHQVEFVNQIMRQQIVPEYMAAKHQDIIAGLAFEFGDLFVRVGAADDAGVLVPRFRLFCGQAVRYDDLVNGVIEP